MPGQSPDDPVDRPSSRVLLLDLSGRVLLFTVNEPDIETGKRFWVPPGGGLEPGETYEQAARRELLEETGIDGQPGPCLWLRTHTWYFSAHNAWYRSIERYFLVRVDRPEVTVDHWTDLEVQTIAGYHWWSQDEIAASTDIFVPRSLASLLPPILAGIISAVPLEVDA